MLMKWFLQSFFSFAQKVLDENNSSRISSEYDGREKCIFTENSASGWKQIYG